MKRMSFLLLLGMMSSALVPLEEFREINYSKQYGLTHDPEVLDILDTVSKTKGVCISFDLYVLFIISS